jgi:hypothetical protein
MALESNEEIPHPHIDGVSLLTVQLGTVPAWVAAAISVIFGIQSWLSSRTSKAEREEAERQAERAERAVSAAEDLVGEARRSAEAGERSASAQEIQARLAAEKVEAEEGSPWILEAIPGRDNCLLRNNTRTPKYDVNASGPAVHPGAGVGGSTIHEVEGGDAVEIYVLRAGGLDDRINVSWQRDKNRSEPRMSRRYRLPPRIG